MIGLYIHIPKFVRMPLSSHAALCIEALTQQPHFADDKSFFLNLSYIVAVCLNAYHNGFYMFFKFRLSTLLVMIAFHKLTSFEPNTRIVVSKATRSSKTATSQNPILVFRSMVLQGGLTLVAKPSTQSASVLRLYVNGVQTEDTECPKASTKRRYVDITLSEDILVDRWLCDTRQLK